MIPPLAIIQARLHSTRFPNKMLAPLQGKPVLQWAWETAAKAFGQENVVIAIPSVDGPAFRTALASAMPDSIWFSYDGFEDDVLGRLAQCASRQRTDVMCPVWRLTPDDVPLQLGRDLTTLGELTTWHETVTDPYLREHVGYLFHPEMPVEINTPEDLAYLERKLAR